MSPVPNTESAGIVKASNFLTKLAVLRIKCGIRCAKGFSRTCKNCANGVNIDDVVGVMYLGTWISLCDFHLIDRFISFQSKSSWSDKKERTGTCKIICSNEVACLFSNWIPLFSSFQTSSWLACSRV